MCSKLKLISRMLQMWFAGHINVIHGPDVGQACCRPIFGLVIVDFLLIRGQFHQPYGAKRKCIDSHSLALVGAVQFHQQKYAQLF